MVAVDGWISHAYQSRADVPYVLDWATRFHVDAGIREERDADACRRRANIDRGVDAMDLAFGVEGRAPELLVHGRVESG